MEVLKREGAQSLPGSRSHSQRMGSSACQEKPTAPPPIGSVAVDAGRGQPLSLLRLLPLWSASRTGAEAGGTCHGRTKGSSGSPSLCGRSLSNKRAVPRTRRNRSRASIRCSSA